MTYCELQKDDKGEQKHSVRIYYLSMVLKPIKWAIHKDHDGLGPLTGDETKGEFTLEMEKEENVKFHASIEFSADVSASGGYGPAKGSASLKTSIGASSEKKAKVMTKKVMTVEQGCSYQPTRIYAKLLCKVIHAKEGDFLANGFGELVTTNKPYEPVAEKHKVSESGYVKATAELHRLYDAFGKDVSTFRRENWGPMWVKMSSVKLKTVVDPADARLYVTGTSAYGQTSPFLSGWLLPHLLKKLVIANKPAITIVYRSGSLGDYRGLCGRDSTHEDKEISYSPGNLVKVWKVAVKAIIDG